MSVRRRICDTGFYRPATFALLLGRWAVALKGEANLPARSTSRRALNLMMVVVVGLLAIPADCHALDGFPVRVMRNGAEIKDQSRVVGTASRDMLLWCFELSPDRQWASVKVPSGSALGWLSIRDAENISIPEQRKAEWEQAHAFYPKWLALIDADAAQDAAQLAEAAGTTMNTILEEVVGVVYPGYPPAATAFNQAGVALLRAGQAQEALEQFERAISINAAAVGSQRVETAVQQANAGEAHVALQHNRRAIEAFDVSLPVLEVAAPDGVSMESYYVRYGSALANEHRIFDARLAFAQALRIVVAKHGERSGEVARVASLFATAMDQAGERKDAVRQLHRSLRIYREIVDAENPLMIDTLNRIAAYQSRDNDFLAAERHAAEAVEIQRNMDRPQEFQLATSLNNLGLAQAKLREFESATANLKEAFQRMTKATSEGHFITSFPLKNQAILALEQSETAKAREILKRVLAIRESTQSEDHASVGAALALLATAAEMDGNTAEAQKHLLRAIRIQGADIGIDHPDARVHRKRLRDLLSDDDQGNRELDDIIIAARKVMRDRVVQDLPQRQYELDAIAQEYRLHRVLAGKQVTKPETSFTALEITTDNTNVRTEGLVPASLAKGTVVYAFRAEGDQALIKIPGANKMGWVRADNVREITYTGELRRKLEAADQQLDEGWREHEAGDDTTAIARLRSAVKTFAEELGEDSAHAAAARFTLGSVLAAAGEVNIAVEECTEAEEVLADLLGEAHIDTANARNNLADALLAAGRPAEALRPAALALQTMSGFGEEQRDSQARVAGNVGRALATLTHYEAAQEYLDYALKLSIEANGENNFGTARCYGTLGLLHNALQEYDAAEVAFGKAFRIADRVSGRTHPNTTLAMLRFGEAQVNNLKISEGRKLIQEAAAIDLRERGPMDLSTIESDATLAALARNVGDTSTTIAKLKSVVDRASKRLGAEHTSVLNYRRSYAEALYLDGQYEAALSEAQRVSAAFVKTLGEANHETITSITATGVCSAALGRLDVARVNFERALRLAHQVLGPDHPETAVCLYNVGEVALMAKDYVAARPRMESAIISFQKNRNIIAGDTCIARTSLGYVDANQGDTRSAVKTFDTAARDTFELMSKVLPALSEKEQLVFLQDDFRDMQHAWMTLPLIAPDHSQVAELAAMWHLNMKGSSHEVLASQTRVARDSDRLANKGAFQELTRVREKLARLSLRSVPSDARATHDEALRKLSSDEERLAREVGDEALALTAPRRWLEWSAYRDSIPPEAIVINFARVRRANYLYSSERTRWKGDRYLAYVIPPAGQGSVAAVDLGLADSIDRQIAITLQAVHSETARRVIAVEGEEHATERAFSELTALSQKILNPLLQYSGETKQLIISPDSQLWTIPWAALPVATDTIAIERYQIRLVVSGRELMAQPVTPQSEALTSAPLIIADPAFDMNPSIAVAVNELDTSRVRSATSRFGETFRGAKSLPGTAAEAAAIKDSLAAYAGTEAELFQRQAATEAVVKTAKSPFCLVLSTHGFFFEAPTIRAGGRLKSNSSVSENPLLRCGLLLAGCHHAEQTPLGQDDGILTGMEIIGSDLRHTELVVLSACETGLGDLRNGEGVAGLRQAFQLAGAKSVIASLWQVKDDATARLMDQFFANLAQGMPRSEALRQAQLTRIKARRNRNGAAHPFFWAAFTLTGND